METRSRLTGSGSATNGLGRAAGGAAARAWGDGATTWRGLRGPGRAGPAGVAEDLHAAIPGSRLVVLPGVGHVCNIEAPDEFNRVVRDVLGP